MAAPAALDTLLEPLRRGRSAPRPARSLMLFLSAAACLVIGFAVVQEMRRERPLAAPEPGHPPQVAVGPGAGERYYQMQPLPTAAPDARALGAADRLLASPPPAIEVAVTAEPLNVYGPLSEAEQAQRVAGSRGDATVLGDEGARRSVSSLAAAQARERQEAVVGGRPQAPARHLTLQVDGVAVAERTGLPPAMAAGRFPVSVTVRDGRVVACATITGAGDPIGDLLCAAVVSLPVRGVSAGTVDGVVVVASSAP
jgi:hypothetical protein